MAFYRLADTSGDVAGERAVFALDMCGYVARKPVDVDSCRSSDLRLIALCEQRGDDSCQHVAASGCGHSGRTCRIEKYLSVRTYSGAVTAFQHDITLYLWATSSALSRRVSDDACEPKMRSNSPAWGVESSRGYVWSMSAGVREMMLRASASNTIGRFMVLIRSQALPYGIVCAMPGPTR